MTEKEETLKDTSFEETPDSPTQGISKHTKDEESEVSDSEDEDQQELLLKGKVSETEDEEDSIEDDPIEDVEDDEPMEDAQSEEDVASSDEDQQPPKKTSKEEEEESSSEEEQPPPPKKKVSKEKKKSSSPKKRIRARKDHNFNLDEKQERIIRKLIASEESAEENKKFVLTEGVNLDRAKARYAFIMKQVKEQNGIPIKIDPQFNTLVSNFDGVLGEWIFYIIGISKDGFRPKIYAGNVHSSFEKKKGVVFLNTTGVFNTSLKESGYSFPKGPVMGKKHTVMFCKDFEKGEDSSPKWMNTSNMFLVQLKRKNSPKSQDEPKPKRKKTAGKPKQKSQMENVHVYTDTKKKLEEVIIPKDVANDASLVMMKHSLIHDCMNADEVTIKKVLKFFKEIKADEKKVTTTNSADSESDDTDSSSE